MKGLKFEPWHLGWMDVQEAQRRELKKLTDAERSALAKTDAYSVADDERIVFCGGSIPILSCNRAIVWCYIGAINRHQFLELHNMVRQHIDGLKFPRLEMEVANDFPQGHRWARALGFKQEPMGGSHALYVRIR